MAVVFGVPVRRALLCVFVVVILVSCLPVWADGEADQLASVQQMIADKKYGDAITALVPLTSSSDKPIARQARESLANCYRYSEQWDRAIPVLESLLRDYPADTPTWKGQLGRCYCGAGQSAKAIATLKEGIEFTPRTRASIEALDGCLWMCCAANNDWDSALSAYQSLLKTCPDEAERWQHQLGRCYRKMGKTPEAIAVFEKEIESAKGDWEAIKRMEPELTDAYCEAKSTEKIVALLRTIDTASPGYSVARAEQLFGQRKFAVAEAIVTPIASSEGPYSTQARWILESCYRGLEQWDKDVPLLESQLRETPERTAWLKAMIGKCYTEMRDCPKAFAALKEGLEFTPRTPDVTALLTKSLRNLCAENRPNWDLAADMYRSLLIKQPKDEARWYYELGHCHQQKRRETEAAECFRKGLMSATITPDLKNDLLYSIRAWCTDVGNWDPAVIIFKSMLAERPKDAAEWQYQLGHSYWKMSWREECVAAFEKALELAKGDRAMAERVATDLSEACAKVDLCHDVVTLFEKLSAQYPRADDFWGARMRECRRNEANSIASKAYGFMHSGDFAKGAAAFLEAIQCSPDLHDIRNAHVCYAECLQGQGKTDEALAYTKKLYDEHKDWRDGALYVQGQISFHSMKYDDAATAFGRVTVDYPKSSYVEYCKTFLVSSLQRAGRTDEAVNALRGFLAEESDGAAKARTTLRLGNIYFEAKRYRNAIVAFKEVKRVKNAPSEIRAEAAYRAGLCYHSIGYDSSARSCMDDAIKLCPNSPWAKQARGTLYVWETYGSELVPDSAKSQ